MTSAWLRSFDDWYDCYYTEEFVQDSVDKRRSDGHLPVRQSLLSLAALKGCDIP
ncbi:MAG: hypothetical protein K5695_10310 [Oscillospiraceae bacterium]|nr:hypothetical protein [Oscillospiraceae bacterium]